MIKMQLLTLMRRPFGEEIADGETDDQLLQTFAQSRDEAAFAALARRYGSLVLSVCRRVLGNSHDAEDAYQSAFLLLARKAHTVRKGRSLGSWLYCVAYRVALDAREKDARRQSHERPASAMNPAQDPEELVAPPARFLDWEEQEAQRALLEEVQRLPDKYQTPVRFCYLEGKTNEQAAQLIGCPSGTIHSRLARARTMLRQRLADRGLAKGTNLYPDRTARHQVN